MALQRERERSKVALGGERFNAAIKQARRGITRALTARGYLKFHPSINCDDR